MEAFTVDDMLDEFPTEYVIVNRARRYLKTCKHCHKWYGAWNPDQATCSYKCKIPYRRSIAGPVVRGSHTWNVNGGPKFQHTHVAEKAFGGPLPPGAVVHHIDEDRTNNANNNLVICEGQGYHSHIHARLRTLRAGGDPDVEKLCCNCKTVKPKSEFGPSKKEWSGHEPVCRPCFRVRRRIYERTYRAKKTYAEAILEAQCE